MDTKTLIDSAATICHGRSNLARRIGARPQQITDWAAGTKAVPLVQRLALCEITGLSETETLNHIREVAGAPAPKSRSIHSALGVAVALFMGSGFAQHAWSLGDEVLGQVDNVYYVN